MRSFHALYGSFRKFVDGTRPFNHCKASLEGLHSIQQYNRKKPNRPNYRKITKPLESNQKLNENPKVYMRDTISNIDKILKYSTWDSAQDQLHKLLLKWDSYTVNQILKTHPPMEKAWLFFNWVSKTKGFKHDQFTYTTMLDIFGEAKRISSMMYVFELMKEKGINIDVVSYTSVMHWLSKAGDVDAAVKIWEEMKVQECYPTVVSYTAYMKILFDNDRVKEATDVYKEMIHCGLAPNCHTYTVLMEYLVGAGKYEEALEIFNKMQEAGVQPDKAACNILIEKCCKAGETRTIIKILHYMKENRLVLRYLVFKEALRTFKFTGENDSLLRQVHPQFSAESIHDDTAIEFVTTDVEGPLSLDQGLVLILLQRQNLVAIDRLLAGIMDKNIQLDSAIISKVIEVNCDCSRPDGALLAFEYSVKMGLNLERTVYLALIGILIRLSTFPKVGEVVGEMTKAGHSLGVYLGALLIYRLGSARRPVSAAKIFNLLPEDQKCTAIYTTMISVYFSAGSADKALKIYKTMQRKGIHPSLGTYNVLLAGLEKLGRASDAEIYRKEKKIIQADAHPEDIVTMDEKICDLLYAGDGLW